MFDKTPLKLLRPEYIFNSKRNKAPSCPRPAPVSLPGALLGGCVGRGLVGLLWVWVWAWVFSVYPAASLDVSERTSPPLPSRRPRVRFLEDVARTDVPQLRLGAERRDAGSVPGRQLRVQLQLQPHPVTAGEPPPPDTARPRPPRGPLPPSLLEHPSRLKCKRAGSRPGPRGTSQTGVLLPRLCG